MIGAVLPTLEHAIYARLANSLENELARDGYSLIVTTSGFDVRKEFAQTQLMIERGAGFADGGGEVQAGGGVTGEFTRVYLSESTSLKKEILDGRTSISWSGGHSIRLRLVK